MAKNTIHSQEVVRTNHPKRGTVRKNLGTRANEEETEEIDTAAASLGMNRQTFVLYHVLKVARQVKAAAPAPSTPNA